METITKKAIELAGGPTKVSRAIEARGGKCSPQAVTQWKKVPDVHVRLVEELGGGAMTRYVIRPDVFGPAPEAQAA